MSHTVASGCFRHRAVHLFDEYSILLLANFSVLVPTALNANHGLLMGDVHPQRERFLLNAPAHAVPFDNGLLESNILSTMT